MKIPVSVPYLPKKIGYEHRLREIWKSKILTHNGPFVQEFESKLNLAFNTRYAVACTSGTVALQLAIKSLRLPKGEIITTPFGWIATISAILAEGLVPRFCDIDQDDFNISINRLKNKINKQTVAILPLHVFGNPCNINEIQEIAKHYKIPVIYDAAHGIGSTYNGRSVFDYGDITCTSFHATKLINSGEGGACFTRSCTYAAQLRRLRFFGFNTKRSVISGGINGKMTELHAALGLQSLYDIKKVLEDRKNKYLIYSRHFERYGQIKLQKITFDQTNFSYFPIVLRSERQAKKTVETLSRYSIEGRRYFFPSLNSYKNLVNYEKMTVSDYISKRIVCLPLHYELTLKQQKMIIDLTTSSLA